MVTFGNGAGRQGHEGPSGVLEMTCVSMQVVVTQVYTYVKVYQVLHLAFVLFTMSIKSGGGSQTHLALNCCSLDPTDVFWEKEPCPYGPFIP